MFFGIFVFFLCEQVVVGCVVQCNSNGIFIYGELFLISVEVDFVFSF